MSANTNVFYRFRRWVKAGDSPLSSRLKRAYFGLRDFHFPVIPGVHSTLYKLHLSLHNGMISLISKLYWTPVFASQLQGECRNLRLMGSGMPYVAGPVTITCGNNCRLATQLAITGRSDSQNPQLILGNNVGIGWQSTIGCGRLIKLGNNVRLAQNCFLSGYPGHPLDAHDRALGLADTDDQVGDIILEDDVWLGSGVRVLPGVTIGRGTIVATGSIVTASLPAFVLAAGVPAKVIRSLDPPNDTEERE